MLRMTSSDPPAMRMAGVPRTNFVQAKVPHSPVSAVIRGPSTSDTQALRLVRLWARASLPIDISGPGSWPAFTLSLARCPVYLATWKSIHTRISWSRRTASSLLPKCSSMPASRSMEATPPPEPPLPEPIEARSFISVVSATRQPSLTSPSRWSSGTRTSLKNTSLKLAPPVIWRSGRISTPGACMSTTKPVRPLCLGWSGSERQMTSPMSEYCAPEVHTFWPVSNHSSPSRTAFICRLARSEPAPGSENSWHPTMSPRCIARR